MTIEPKKDEEYKSTIHVDENEIGPKACFKVDNAREFLLSQVDQKTTAFR